MSLRATRGDNEHIPCVIVINSSGGVLPEHLIHPTTKAVVNGKELKGSIWQ